MEHVVVLRKEFASHVLNTSFEGVEGLLGIYLEVPFAVKGEYLAVDFLKIGLGVKSNRGHIPWRGHQRHALLYLLGGEAVPVDFGIRASDAAVKAVVLAVVREFDDASEIHLVPETGR